MAGTAAFVVNRTRVPGWEQVSVRCRNAAAARGWTPLFFETAEDDVLKNTVKGGQRLSIPDQFATSYLAEVEKTYPEYFSDLPALPR